MHVIQKPGIRQHQTLVRNRLRSAAESVAIDELIRQRHDVLVHAILVSHVNHGLRMSVRQTPEERHIKSAVAGLLVSNLSNGVSGFASQCRGPYKGRELKVVSDENERFRKTQGSKASR